MGTGMDRFGVAFGLLSACALLALFGCSLGDSGSRQSTGATDGEGATGPGQPTSEQAPGSDAATQRAAFIYAAVLEQAAKDARPDRGGTRFRVIFVLDGAVAHAARPRIPADPKQPFTATLKDGVRFLGARMGLPRIEFIAVKESALRGPGAGRHAARVRNRGLLVSLGPIRTRERRAEIGVNLWVDVRAMRWLTYVAKKKRGRWEVVGTTGLMAIS
jgi:hypothetical protein